MKNQKGFTLIEMVVVLAIFSILAAAAYPRISGYMESRREQYKQNQEYVINKTLMQYYALTGRYCKVDCESGGLITPGTALILFEELRDKTGATIVNASGDKYQYTNTSLESGIGVEIKKIKVELLP